MTLGTFLKYFATYQALSVFELGGASVARDVIACEIPLAFLSRDVVRFYVEQNRLCITIEEV